MSKSKLYCKNDDKTYTFLKIFIAAGDFCTLGKMHKPLFSLPCLSVCLSVCVSVSNTTQK